MSALNGRLAILLIIFLTVALNAAAQLLLRAAMRSGIPALPSPFETAVNVALRPGVVGGLLCYGLSVLTWIYVLSKTEVSFAYPFLGVGFVVVAVTACLFLGEDFTARKMIGTLIIAVGVVVLAGR